MRCRKKVSDALSVRTGLLQRLVRRPYVFFVEDKGLLQVELEHPYVRVVQFVDDALFEDLVAAIVRPDGGAMKTNTAAPVIKVMIAQREGVERRISTSV